MKKKILLTGASGDVGSDAFAELLNRRDRYNLRILSLDKKYERKLFKPYADLIDIIWGDLQNPDDVNKAVDGVDTVIHLAALIPPAADHRPDLAWKINVDGTRSLVAAMLKQNPTPELIYASSISVYGDRVANPNIRVGDRLNPSIGDEYAKTKIAAEKLIKQSGLKWSILRLCGILTTRLKVQPLMFHMPLDTALEWCHSSDAGYALVEAVEHESAFGRIFNLGGGEKCRVKAGEFLAVMLPFYGVDASTLPEHAFATRNFHSGDYADGDELNAILHFRRKSLKDYYDAARDRISPLSRFLVGLVPKFMIRRYLIRMSAPLKAIKENDTKLIERFYGSRRAFENMSKCCDRTAYAV